MYGCPCGDGPCDGTARKRNCAHVGGGAARIEKPLEFPKKVWAYDIIPFMYCNGTFAGRAK